MRRRIVGLLGVVAVLTVVALVPATGQDPTTAKQEGKVVIYYGTGPQALRDSIKSAFERKYPEITIEWVGGRGAAETISKFLNEYDKGVKSADVIASGQSGLFDILQKPDSLAKYVPKDTGWLSADLKDKDGRWASYVTVLYVIGYNTNLVPQAAAPKSYRDLLDPKWTGKIGAADPKSTPSFMVWHVDQRSASQCCQAVHGFHLLERGATTCGGRRANCDHARSTVLQSRLGPPGKEVDPVGTCDRCGEGCVLKVVLGQV